MFGQDHTVTSPQSADTKSNAMKLALTVIWHSDSDLIGAQYQWPQGLRLLELSRLNPGFYLIDKNQTRNLGTSSLSRTPVLIDWNRDLRIKVPESRMHVSVNGENVVGEVVLTEAQVQHGVILGLGRSVILCLHLTRGLRFDGCVNEISGVGDAAIRLRQQIAQIADRDLPVLLLGETGTGKEMAARAIHRLSSRAAKRMVSVNMAALNDSLAAADLFGAVKGAYTGASQNRKGYFLEAENSTLFLDEIGNTPASIQPMLLRVIENGEYRALGASVDSVANVRVITATDQNLYDGKFNPALLTRLESLVIRMPALRERREDIGILIRDLMRREQFDMALLSEVPFECWVSLCCYDWPGNIRELIQVIRRIAVNIKVGEVPEWSNLVPKQKSRLGGRVILPNLAKESNDTPFFVTTEADSIQINTPRKRLSEISDYDVLSALEKHSWYILAAANELGISRPSMYKLIESHPQIRRAQDIPAKELMLSLERHRRDIEACARDLRTPAEALRRYIQLMGLQNA